MNAQQLVQYATTAVFLAMFAIALGRAVRRPTRQSIDVALLFLAPALALAHSALMALLGAAMPVWLSAVPVTALLALPALTLRALATIVAIPRFAVAAAVATWLVSAGLVAAAGTPPPGGVPAFVVVGFVGLEAYAGVLVARASGAARGVSRRRLELIAAGTLCFGLAMAAAGAAILSPLIGLLALPLALASGLCYLLGFAPPPVLRRTWLAPALFSFIGTATRLATEPGEDVLLRGLATAVASVMGTRDAGVGIYDAERALLVYWPARGEKLERRLEESMTGRVVLEQRAMVLEESPGAPGVPERFRSRARHTVLAAPMTVGDDRIGVASMILDNAATFVDDDLELLRLVADQAAVVVEHRRLYTRVSELNEDLRRRLTELRVLNDELTSFAYSVSHDLRAPLRSIDGFSLILLEDHAEGLGEEGRRILGRIRAGAVQMGLLIEDLLTLSRVTRDEMRPAEVDLAAMATEIVEELRRRDRVRAVDFTCDGAAPARGDPRLLRVVLTNLLENAWKFTRTRERAHIAFDTERRDGLLVFHVRDDGAGFDMRYADKLFGPFQRLHSQAEFEGTGIGLATVQRIIHRHGGSVWAEAEVGRGATFSFALSSPPAGGAE